MKSQTDADYKPPFILSVRLDNTSTGAQVLVKSFSGHECNYAYDRGVRGQVQEEMTDLQRLIPTNKRIIL